MNKISLRALLLAGATLLSGCFESSAPKFALAGATRIFGTGGRYTVYEHIEGDQYKRQEILTMRSYARIALSFTALLTPLWGQDYLDTVVERARKEFQVPGIAVAVVKDGKVFVLYRAEDDSGDMMIGGHTSRIGLAESTDGLHFTRRPAPVLYPDNDGEKDRAVPARHSRRNRRLGQSSRPVAAA